MKPFNRYHPAFGVLAVSCLQPAAAPEDTQYAIDRTRACSHSPSLSDGLLMTALC
jgi:hypothetical protein